MHDTQCWNAGIKDKRQKRPTLSRWRLLCWLIWN